MAAIRRFTLFALTLCALGAPFPQAASAQVQPCGLTTSGNNLIVSCAASPAPPPAAIPTMAPFSSWRTSINTQQGGNGSNGGSSLSPGCFTPCGGSPGGNGANITGSVGSGVLLYVNLALPTAPAAVLLQTIGGNGGSGGNGAVGVSGASGGAGGAGGTISSLTIGSGGNLPILTTVVNTPGVWARSVGGTGGNGGSGFLSNGGSGAPGGSGGAVSIGIGANIFTFGAEGYGILAQSLGGNGGSGGSTWIPIGTSGGNGASGQSGNNVSVTLTSGGSILTSGAYATGILAQSIGGFGGAGGNGNGGVVTFGGTGATGGLGGTILVTTQNATSIWTLGSDADAIFAESVGGGGGAGGTAGALFAMGARGSPGGNGNSVTVNNGATITTSAALSKGIFAQSVGGGGGDGGATGGLLTLGGAASNGSNAGSVRVFNTGNITTYDNGNGIGDGSSLGSAAILAQAIGGTGGNGGDANGWISLGGSGGGGGNGATVLLGNSGNLTTFANYSQGVLGQSIGGGGGNGGGAVGVGFVGALAIGGSGGSGGYGSTVQYDGLGGAISTAGAFSEGIETQSVGGGGGNGGAAISVAAAAGAGIAIALGGSGGGGGYGGNVSLVGNGSITTTGAESDGILAQSVGGGGGSGGLSVSAAVGANFGAMALSLGGTGGGGGAGRGTVQVLSSYNVTTSGDDSAGIVAQSVGGGGGSGGDAIAASASKVASLSLALGAKGGSGGTGNSVQLVSRGTIQTGGANAVGLLAQSLGGGGGNGGVSVAASLASIAGGFALGGVGGVGQDAGAVQLSNAGNVTTGGVDAVGVLAQSMGGGGGNGGYSVSGSIGGGTANVSIGGNGATGGNAGTVALNNSQFANNTIVTQGANADGIVAQSIGGSGGNGGFSVSGGASSTVSINASVGGGAGNGAAGSTVTLDSGQFLGGGNLAVATIDTFGNNSNGIVAQSIGGGGGNGGWSVSGGLSGGAAVGFSIGGAGGAGSTSDAVTVNSLSNIATQGANANDIVAQSIGGGGGNGGFSVTGTGGVSFAGGINIGGGGGSGGTGWLVSVQSNGTLSTMGDLADGILAQSIGGGGGDGGFSVAGSLSTGPTGSISVGGAGGNGATSNTVVVRQTGNVTTQGNESGGVVAQSIGGGGGNGGWSVGGGIAANSPALAISVGGFGGTGSDAGTAVAFFTSGTLTTQGANAAGVVAESIGGGGGNGGFSVAGQIANGGNLGLSIGGFGGSAGNGAAVSVVTGATSITTAGAESPGIASESIGGGGGNGGFAVVGSLTAATTLNLGIGGYGNSGGTAALTTVTSGSTIQTSGDESAGMQVQSIGGGGGNGGFSVSGSVSQQYSGSVAIGGTGRGGSAGGQIQFSSSGQSITTSGNDSAGILAQSIGGGGGNGGFAVSGQANFSKGGTATGLNLSIGGFGGNGSNGVLVIGAVGSTIVTTGNDSVGILAESIGGGGGNGGFAVNATFTQGQVANIALGGEGGGGGGGGNVSFSDDASAETFGASSAALEGQSIGGGGGNGGFAVAATAAVTPPGQPQNSTSFTGTFGGNGGTGGSAGTVRITAGAAAAAAQFDLVTNGDNSDGILAQSLGGGGGNGGFAVTFQVQGGAKLPNSSPLGSYSLAFGGNGGKGASSNVVTVNNFDNIATYGNNSAAIDAQSIGGGGGNGGFSVNGSINTTGNQVALSFGGSGGNGNIGNNVTVNSGTATNSVWIETRGNAAQGILAQSIGGGGGNGGFSVAVAAGSTSSILSAAPGKGLSLGSAGGSGNNAGTVTVSSYSNIFTTGNQSIGIEAQSVGDGGGSGAFTFSGSVTPKTGSGSFAYGSGGGSGSGNIVTVTNSGTIETQGEQSDGILAQSIGGGGGFGGSTWTTTFANQAGVSSIPLGVTDISMGSNAAGSSGNSVTVTNYGSIATSGSQSAAIDAQSVGGAGGEGGMSISGSIDTTADKVSAPGFAFGASGGAGGGGGSVTVNSTASLLQTSGVESDGIFALSLGGGGGKGGLAVTGSISQPPTATIAMGGYGGGGGGAQAVTIMTGGNGSIVTMGDLSIGIEAESIAGGGGSGGNAITGQASKSAFTANVALGSPGGSGGAGDNVNVTDNAAVQTEGDAADGVLAQSLGGGGGNAGYAIVGSLNQYGTANVAYGMTGGAGGSGAGATVTQTGDVFTQGVVSNAIVAQSIGAGGGNGGFTVGAGISGGGLSLALGASGGAGGSGAAVAVTTSAASIGTVGDLSNAILAQSIGGGGGNQGWNVAGQVSLLPIFIGAGASNGSGGNGGSVTVTNTGGIGTEGLLSNGIVAQSIGGGGGYVTANQTTNVKLGADKVTSGGGSGVSVSNGPGGAIETLGDGSFGIFAQSVGGGGGAIFAPSTVTLQEGSGNGSQVAVTDAGAIFTSGVGADGIFAQSVGGGGGYAGASGTFVAGSGNGSGSAGLVSVLVSGTDITTGAGAVALYEQSAAGSDSAGGRVSANISGTVSAQNASAIYETSTGGRGGGQVNVTVTPSGEVFSGVTNGSDATPTAGAITFAAGGNATLFNNGVISAPSGYAIVSNLAATSLANNGDLAGSIWLAPGANAFTNTGTFAAGPVVNLGSASNTLTNNGTLAIGFLPSGGTTTITGSLTQGPSGTLFETVNLGAPDPPELVVTGDASLQGTLAIASLNAGQATPGTHSFTLIGVDGTLTDSMTLSSPPSAIVRYTLDPAANGTVVVQSNVDFNARGLTGEGSAFGAYLDKVQAAGSTPALQGMIAQAISMPTSGPLERLYDELTPESFDAMEAATLTNALGFSQQMMTCRTSDVAFASSDDDRCTWSTIGSASTVQSRGADVLGYNENATGVSLGIENPIGADKHTFLGTAFNFADDNLSVDSETMTGSRYMAGVQLKRRADSGFVYSAQLTGGVANYLTNRRIAFPTSSMPPLQAAATGHVSFVSGGVRTAKLWNFQSGWTISPYLALNETRLHASPLSESGAGAMNVTTQATADTFVTLQPGVQLERAIGTIGGTLHQMRFDLGLSATQFLGNHQTSLSAMLQGAPAGLGMAQFNSSIDRTLWNVAPTFEVAGEHGLAVRLGGTYFFSSHLHSGTVNVNISQKI